MKENTELLLVGVEPGTLHMENLCVNHYTTAEAAELEIFEYN